MTPGSPSAPAAAPPAAPPPRSRLQRILGYRLLLSIAAGVFILDQVTKAWIRSVLPYGPYGPTGRIVVIPGFFDLIHVGNTGAAWSMFSSDNTILAVLAGAVLIAIFAWRRQLGLRIRSVQVSFGLLCGGILGNLADRITHGHVVDFLDFHFDRYVYPTFNLADSAICVGVILYILHTLRQPRPPQS